MDGQTSWLIFVGINLLADAFRIFLDNYIGDFYFKGRGSVAQKLFHGAFQVVVGLIAIPVSGINLNTLEWLPLLLCAVSGVIISLGGIPYYRALELDDSTNLGIFIQLTPVLYLIFGWLFFGETISLLQLLSFVIILSAPLLILKTTQKRSRKIRIQAILQAFAYVLASVLANMLFVKQEDSLSAGLEGVHMFQMFVCAMGFFYLGKGISNVIIVGVVPKWRKRFVTVMQQHKRKVPAMLFSNATLAVIADASYRLALTLAPSMAIASVTSDATEPIVIFFMGIILTLISPKFGREKLGKKSILVHLGATVLVVVGIALLQSQK